VGEIRNVRRAAEEVGLDETGFAIYELLGEAETDGAAGGRPVDLSRHALAAAILESLQELAVVDWTHKEDVQRRMRQAIKARLRSTGYTREQVEALTTRLMDLARVRLA
jgi:type I restriction enzyme R subunit